VAKTDQHFHITRTKLFHRFGRGARKLLGPVRRAWDPSTVLPVVALSELVRSTPDVLLRTWSWANGNVSPLELLTIAALVAEHQPRCILEIGTFNGNTTLQMAENAPAGAKVYTLDLPFEGGPTDKLVDSADVHYIHSAQRAQRRFTGLPAATKIHELFGDSATFDFAGTVGGDRVDFAFIDGAHSYEYVKSDTERMMPLLSPKGAVVLWHDYQPFWTGVCHYLNALSKQIPLQRIEGTCIVYYRAPAKH
jgi:Methyltransferase domain